MIGKKNSKDKGRGTKLDTLFNLLAQADKTYADMPMNVRLAVEKVSQGLAEFGPRKLRFKGLGTEFFEARDFRRDSDDPRKINARLSARAGRNVVVEKEAEIRQHFYLWRDGSGSMDYKSAEEHFTKKESAEIMMLAMAKHLAKNEEMIGLLDGKGTYRGGKAPELMAQQLHNVVVATGDMPVLNRKFPRHSTVVMFSDFFMGADKLRDSLRNLSSRNLNGYLVMVMDPQELDFDFTGNIEFEGLEGEGLQDPGDKAESLREAYMAEMKAYIEEIGQVAREKGFTFILQRTDEPLSQGLLEIYGLTGQKKPASRPGVDRPSNPQM